MKTLKILVATGLTMASFAAAAYTAGAGITGTPHDWSGASGQKFLLWCTDGTTSCAAPTTYVTANAWIDPATGVQGKSATAVRIGQCTRCHTPHQAKSTNLLWNHTLTTVLYKWDQPETTAGTPYATFKGDTYKGPTTKCLSCHDGTLASTDGMWFNRQFVAGSKYVPPAGALDSGHEVAHGATGGMQGTHPVAMPYPAGGITNTYNGVSTGSELDTTEYETAPAIRLFNDDGAGNITAGAINGKSGIECTSCHDVHNGKRVKDQLLLTGMLGGAKADGYICTQCHKK